MDKKNKSLGVVKEKLTKYGDPQQLLGKLTQKCDEFENLRQSMLDMRKALTEEVANKHDIICSLKRDISKLEEQCIQVDKQTAFKDDIIKELRKEIKHLKLEEYEAEISGLQARNATSFTENLSLKNQLNQIRDEVKNSTAISAFNISKVLTNLENTDFSEDLSSIQNYIDKENLLIDVMEKEITALKEAVQIKDEQLEKQLEIITELVTQLYTLNKGLSILENKFINILDDTSAKTISKYLEDLASNKTLNEQLSKNNGVSCNCKKKSETMYSENASMKTVELERERWRRRSLELEQENSLLNNKVEETKILSRKLEKEFDHFLQEKDDLKMKLKSERTATEQQTKKLTTTCETKLKEISNLKNEIASLKIDLEKSDKENKYLNDEIDKLQKDCQKSKKTLQVAENGKDKTEDLQKKVDECKNLVTTKQNEIDKLCQENKKLLEDINKLKLPEQVKIVKCPRRNDVGVGDQTYKVNTRSVQMQTSAYPAAFSNTSYQKSGTICLCHKQTNTGDPEFKSGTICLCQKQTNTGDLQSKSGTICLCQKQTNTGDLQSAKPELIPSIKLNQNDCNKICQRVTINQDPKVREFDPGFSGFAQEVRTDGVKPSGICRGTSTQLEPPRETANQLELGKKTSDQMCEAKTQNKDERIQIQNDTLNITQLQLQEYASKGTQCSQKPSQAVQKCEHMDEIADLQSALEDCQGRANNLQNAVDLYINSINVLEAAEENAKMEIEQQRITINNLQGALVSVKQEFEELKAQNKQEINQHLNAIDVLYVNLLQLEGVNSNLMQQVKQLTTAYEHLQNLNLNLEVEHCNCLQDISIFETRISKYQLVCKENENNCVCLQRQISLLTSQKSCYEDLLRYFQYEMKLMSEQLCTLQEILKMSCVSSQSENHQLVNAVEKLQCMNQCLSSELSCIDQKYSIECQMNKMKEGKLLEMEKKLQSKCLELSHSNDSCKQLTTQLEKVLHRNKDFEKVICGCNGQLRDLQKTIKEYETENSNQMCNRKQCKCQIEQCERNLKELKKLLDMKDRDLECLQKEYKTQLNVLISTQSELDKVKKELCEKNNTINHLKKSVCDSKEDNKVLYEECSELKQQINCLSKQEMGKEKGIKSYQKLISDLKNMLTRSDSPIHGYLPNVKSNQNECASPEDNYLHVGDEIKQIIHHLINIFCNSKEEQKKAQEDINKLQQKVNCLSKRELGKENEVKSYQKVLFELKNILSRSDACVESSHSYHPKFKTPECTSEDTYKQMAEEIKSMICDFKKQLMEKECAIKKLERQNCKNEETLKDTSKKSKDKEMLSQKLAHYQGEEKRLNQVIKNLQCEVSNLRDELKEKDKQLNCFRENLQKIKSGKNVQLTCVQDECNILKNEINQLMQRQMCLTQENEKLSANVMRFQKRATELEEKNIIMNDQLEQYMLELENIHHEKELIEQKYHQLSCDFQSLQNNFACLERQNRYSTDTLHTLEQELRDIKAHKDDITYESRHVIENMNLWLREQRNINQQISKKMKEHCETIERLKFENESLKQRQEADNHQSNCNPPSMKQSHRSQSRDRNIKCKQQNIPEASGWNVRTHYRNDSPDFTSENDRGRRCNTPTWSLGSQGTGSYACSTNDCPGQSPCEQSPSIQDWYSPNFRDTEDTDEEDICSEQFIEKVQSMVAQFQKANKLWKTRMNNCEYCVSKDDKFA